MESNNIIYLTVSNPSKRHQIVKYPRSGTWLIESESTGLNAWKIKIPDGNYDIIGGVDNSPEGNFAIRKLK